MITCIFVEYVWVVPAPRKAAEFDSRLCFMLGWLPLLYVFPLCSKGRGEDRRRFKNAGETRSCFHRSLLFQPTDTSPKNSMKNYRIIFNSDDQLPYIDVHFYELLSSRLYIERFDVVSLSPLERRATT